MFADIKVETEVEVQPQLPEMLAHLVQACQALHMMWQVWSLPSDIPLKQDIFQSNITFVIFLY